MWIWTNGNTERGHYKDHVTLARFLINSSFFMTSTRRNSLDVKVVPMSMNGSDSGNGSITVDGGGMKNKNNTNNGSIKVDTNLSATSLQPRSIDLRGGVMMIVSLMIGSGIFTFAGEIHGHVRSAGMALTVWFVSGLLALTGALCYAELGTMIPGSGGEAQYLKRGFGPLFTYLFDWSSIFILKPGTVALMLLSFSQYTMELIKMAVAVDESSDLWVKILASVGCVGVTALSACSHRWSNRILDGLTWCKVAALVMIIGGGMIFCVAKDSAVFRANVLTQPFTEMTLSPDSKVKSKSLNFVGRLVVALCAGLWGFEGWNNLNIVSGDLREPKKNLPLAIWISVGSVLGLYLATLLAYYCVLPGDIFVESEAVGLHFGKTVVGALFGEKAAWLGAAVLSLAIMGSTFSAALSSMLTSSEIIVLSAENGNIPARFGVIDARTRTAFNAYTMQGILSVLLTIVFSDNLITLYTFPTWIFYTLCALVLMKLRFTEPNLERPYRVLISTPVLFLISCALLIASLAVEKFTQVLVSLLVIAAGVPVYYLYAAKNARESKK